MKQVILLRHDLKLPKGKAAAQCAHAAVEAALKVESAKLRAWRASGSAKIVVKIENENQLHKYAQAAKDAGIITAVITDAGKTVIAPGTVTCCAIGPDDDEVVDSITGNLKLL